MKLLLELSSKFLEELVQEEGSPNAEFRSFRKEESPDLSPEMSLDQSKEKIKLFYSKLKERPEE